MRTLLRATVVVVVSTAFATAALADCWYDGQLKPEGTRIGDLVCENGQWKIVP